MERTPVFTEEHVIEIGKQGYVDYYYQADNSDVPVDFFRVSRSMSPDLIPQSSWTGLAEVLIGGGFDNENDAKTAIRYAEAISKLKEIHSNPRADDKEVKEARLAVGLALLNERSVEATFDIKRKVEKYFGDPSNLLKIRFLAKSIGSSIIN